MDNNDVQLVGGPCGQHGPYTFYKAFKYQKNGFKKIITLSEFFFVKMWRDSDLLCIGELQLLWTDKNSEQTLASLRLYFLPENTPEGRIGQGEDEVLAISEKVVIRLEDLITWITIETEWNWGRLAKCEDELKDVTIDPDQTACPRKPAGNSFNLSETTMDFSDVEQERDMFEDPSKSNPHVIILSFPRYCRYRAMMKRLEGVENLYLKYKIVNALGGFYVKHPNTRILFCKDTFDYPELEGHELLCNHLAPKLKGRPRGKRKKRSISPGSESNESESSITNQLTKGIEKSNGLCSNTVATRRSTRCHENNENKQFMKILSAFMKSRRLPMGRIPSLGYKELNLYEFYTRVQRLGGYDCVTTNRLWKSVFDDMTGHLNSTSAATIIRRHYERFLLAYERHEKGEQYKPLPSENRKLKKKQQDSPTPPNESSESESGTDTPSPSTSRSTSSPPVVMENKESSSPGKPSSLRSVRVKPDRQKDKPSIDDQNKSEPIIAMNQNSSEHDQNEDCKTIVETDNVERIEENVTVKIEDGESEIKVEPQEIVDVKEELTEITSIKEEKKPKSEPDDVTPSVPEGTKTEGSILPEPMTNAVTPVAMPVIPDKSPSPMEGKENISDIATISPTSSNINHQCSISPEIIKTELEIHKDEKEGLVQDVKRIKLDILKEGGLEVTPVRSISMATSVKDIRPSVIQPPLKSDSPNPIMAPPSIHSSFLPKKNPSGLSSGMHITHIKSASTTPVKQDKPESFPFINGGTPPKVVQSKSIYSYSEKTIYGNPKDVLQPMMVPHAPKSMNLGMRPGGGDPVDLSLTSPQKPAVEIMPVPQNFTSIAHTPYNRASVTKNLYRTTPPQLEGRRLGPNLEITLVGPRQPQQSSSVPRQTSHRRGSETYAQKIAKLKSEELISRQSKYNNTHMYKSNMDIPVPSRYSKSSSSVSVQKPDIRPTQYVGQKPNLIPSMPQAVPPYFAPRFGAPESSNGMNPFLPLMDPLIYQAALQNVYSNLPNMPPMLPMPSAEQLKFYADLMAHGRLSNLGMQFPPTADGHPSLNNNKKA